MKKKFQCFCRRLQRNVTRHKFSPWWNGQKRPTLTRFQVLLFYIRHTCSCNDAELFAIKINTLIIRLLSSYTFMVFFFFVLYDLKIFITTVVVSFRFILNEHATIESKSSFPLFIFFLIKYLLFTAFLSRRPARRNRNNCTKTKNSNTDCSRYNTIFVEVLFTYIIYFLYD